MNIPNNSIVQSYLFFEGRCEEAVEFYKKALGARVEMLMRFKDSPDPNACNAEIDGNKIMHTSFKIGESLVMASDGRCASPTKFQGFALSISVKEEKDANAAFNALTEDGNVIMPIMKTFWSPRFGMVTDKFGVMWMISVMP